jgi:hypothetical protein
VTPRALTARAGQGVKDLTPSARASLAAGAVALGLCAGWAASGRIAAVAVLAVVVAAANGYAKAYSP